MKKTSRQSEGAPKGADNEPVDAEFETLDSAGETGQPSVPGKKSALRQFFIRAGLTLVVLAIVVAGGFWLLRSQSLFSRGIAPSAQIASLTARLDGLQKELDAVRQGAAKTQRALANLPRSAPADAAVLKEIEPRLAALEQARTTLPADAQSLAPLVARLDKMQKHLAVLDRSAASAPADHAALAALQQRLTALESADRQSAPADPALAQSLQDLQGQMADMPARLAALEARSLQAGRRSALALALLALDAASQTGKPFVHEWRVLHEALPANGPENPDVQALQSLAQTGVPSRAALARLFTSQKEAIRMAARGPDAPTKKGLAGRAMSALGGLISVRRIDGGGGVDTVLVQAQTALQASDLSAAVQALGGLNGNAHKAAQGWLMQARARLALERALARLKAAIGKPVPQEAAP